MGKLKDFVPSANDVMDNPTGWVLSPAATTLKHGDKEKKEDKAKDAATAAYKAIHPGVVLPTRGDTKIRGARAAANRRKSGRLSTVLSDSETLG